ncbi:phage tail protein [Kushneria sp. AK178]
MADVMLKLGRYAFCVDTAAYQQLHRATRWTWASQSRVGAREALQYTGKAGEVITLDGIIYPEYRGGAGQLDRMRAEADKARPLLMVDGNGYIHGRWVVESIEETGEIHARGGTPRRQRFVIQIRYRDDGAGVQNEEE